MTVKICIGFAEIEKSETMLLYVGAWAYFLVTSVVGILTFDRQLIFHAVISGIVVWVLHAFIGEVYPTYNSASIRHFHLQEM